MRPRRDLKYFSIGTKCDYYSVTIQETEEKKKRNRGNPGKMLDIAHLNRDKYACGKHDCRYCKAIGIGELSRIVESSDNNNGRYHNWMLTSGFSISNGEDTHESSLQRVYKFDPEPCPTYAPCVA